MMKKEKKKKPEIVEENKELLKVQEELRSSLVEKEQLQDKYMRFAAEFENFKKRTQKETEQFLQFSNKQILSQLLPIIDDFDRAHDAAKEHAHGEVFSKGVEIILNQLHKLLNDNGVEKISSVGNKFDPHMHEAIASVESDEHEEYVITEEIAPGYMINGQLLRAAKVRIAKKGSNDA
jgi:molecular chaperone GrpE